MLRSHVLSDSFGPSASLNAAEVKARTVVSLASCYRLLGGRCAALRAEEDTSWRAAATGVLEQLRELECASEFLEPVQLNFDVGSSDECPPARFHMECIGSICHS